MNDQLFQEQSRKDLDNLNLIGFKIFDLSFYFSALKYFTISKPSDYFVSNCYKQFKCACIFGRIICLPNVPFIAIHRTYHYWHGIGYCNGRNVFLEIQCATSVPS
mgnify:CR=1 FL=1